MSNPLPLISLPPELLIEIVSHINAPDLISFCRTNQQTHELCNEHADYLFGRLYEKDFHNIPRKTNNVMRDYINLYDMISNFLVPMQAVACYYIYRREFMG